MRATDDTNRLLLRRAIGAAKAGDHDEARFLLEWMLMRDITREQRVEALYWLAVIQEAPEKKRTYLQEVLALAPWHAEARRALALLDGRLDPDEVIDPNQLTDTAPPPPQAANARRFVCTQCGGQLTFLPTRNQLHCRHCGHTVSLLDTLDEGAVVEERDFLVDLATRRGHVSANYTRTFTCQTCGATYLSDTISVAFTCPYCHSAYVAELEETRDLIPPEGIIPMRLSGQDAETAIRAWLASHRLHPLHQENPRGIYLPIWTFDIGGILGYTYQVAGRNNDTLPWNISATVETIRSEWSVLANDVPVLATHSLPADIASCVQRLDLSAVHPFAPEYLAGWPAETYAIAPADASIVARATVVAHERERLLRQIVASNPFLAVKDFRTDSSRVIVEAFKLVLAPFWVSDYTLRGHAKPFVVVVNGFNGEVCGQMPGSTAERWWRRFRRWLGL